MLRIIYGLMEKKKVKQQISITIDNKQLIIV
jgi:hypothetical protein